MCVLAHHQAPQAAPYDPALRGAVHLVGSLKGALQEHGDRQRDGHADEAHKNLVRHVRVVWERVAHVVPQRRVARLAARQAVHIGALQVGELGGQVAACAQ